MCFNSEGDINTLEFLNSDYINKLHVTGDIKDFGDVYFFVAKRNEYKNWHKLIAHMDIIEFMRELMK